jgi:hypothetical protein
MTNSKAPTPNGRCIRLTPGDDGLQRDQSEDGDDHGAA